MLQLRGALARQLAPAACAALAARLGPAAAAALHHAAAPVQQETAPERMEQAAQAVAAVMGEESEVPPAPPPLPAHKLNFDDPRAAFKVRMWLYASTQPCCFLICAQCSSAES